MTPAPMSSVPLMASFAEQQPLSTLQPRLQQESEANSTTSAAAPAAAVESDRKGLEDEKEVVITLTAAEISKHNSEEDAWIVVDGVVYDITEFLGTHPGGVEVIMEHLGEVKDVGKLMRGEQADLPDSHPHSKYAFRMLQQFRIGRVSDYRSGKVHEAESTSRSNIDQYGVDLGKPLVFQVGKLGSVYDKWVHDPIVQKEPPRFFESDIAEFFTQTAWWVIPVVWVPLVIQLAAMAYRQGLWLTATPFAMGVGAFIWTFIEYLLHRFVFHMQASNYWTCTLHYFLHGFHHKHPMDGTRLVFPPAITALIVATIWVVMEPLVSIVGRPVKLSLFSGGLLMYVVYDLTHYFLHFGTAFSEASRDLKRFHLNHHFKDQTNSYGVTTSFWDGVFGTLPPPCNPAAMEAVKYNRSHACTKNQTFDNLLRAK